MKHVVRTMPALYRFCEVVRETLGEDFGKPYTVSIRKFHRPRSIDQNSKFHAMIADIAQHLGWERPDELKDYIKSEFGLKATRRVGDHKATIALSTTRYNVIQMSDLIDRVYQFGAELGVEWEQYEPDSPNPV